MSANASNHLENPLPHIREVQRSASRIVQLEKQLLGNRAEVAAIHQLKKLVWAVLGLVSAIMALIFGFGWLSIALNESGWSAIAIALFSFGFFGVFATLFTFLFLRSLELKEDTPS